MSNDKIRKPKIVKGKKFIGLVIVVVVLITGGLFLFKNLVGDIRPIIFPPSRDLPEIIEKQNTGEAVDFPLDIDRDFRIGVFAEDLGAARDLQFSPGGTLLVSSKNTGRVYALPDKNGDGKADKKIEVLKGLENPHGLAFNGGKLFVAELRGVSRYNWNEDELSATLDKKLFNLPYNGGHSTRSIVIDSDGSLFVSIGSSCNVCVEDHPYLTTIVVSNTKGENPEVYARGLRNAVFMKLHSETGRLWVTEMGRDWLGDDIPPDEINIIQEGGDYGWPYCYGDKVHDDEFDPNRQRSCNNTVAPVFNIQAHSAPLGLNFINSGQFPTDWQGDLLVSYHGSWNRTVPTGYKVARLKIENGKVTNQEDFITGFLQGSNALGRPVDVEFDKNGSLYISDDKIGVIYKVVKE